MFEAGAAAVEITPRDSQFLFGYPHVRRYSTGVHDPLYASSLAVSDGKAAAIFVANDIIFVPKDLAARARGRIARRTGVAAPAIMITATHTHSGPHTAWYVSNDADAAVPKPDGAYLRRMEDAMVDSAAGAFEAMARAEVALAVADCPGVGANRRDVRGPSDPQVPVLAVRRPGGRYVAIMLVCSMHPTVLHEDSTLVSGDFPGLSRQHVQGTLGPCPVLHHSGPCGNQSPRHVVRAHTFAEAQRLGAILGDAVVGALKVAKYIDQAPIACLQEKIDLPRKRFPTVAHARAALDKAKDRLERLRGGNAPQAEIRTAECDWFGAEEALTLAEAAVDGRLERAYAAVLPAEVQVIRVGPWAFVGWSGEVFVEYGLAVKKRFADTYVISMANGELQGYIVTPEAAAEGGYEASNALFEPRAGQILVDTTSRLLGSLG